MECCLKEEVHSERRKKLSIGEFCSSEYSQENYDNDQRHLSQLNGQESICEVCSKKFIKIHPTSTYEEKSFACEECLEAVSEKKNLPVLLHNHTNDQLNSGNKIVSQKEDIKTNIHTGLRPFVCEVCSRSFSKKKYLIKHLHIHTKDQLISEKNSKIVSQKEDINANVHTGLKPFACEVCSRNFSKKKNLIRHLNIHTGERPFICGVCCKTFTMKTNLITHVQSHTGKKTFICEMCCRTFSEKSSLLRHIVCIHTGEKPFTCEICSKGLCSKGSLNIHLRIHTGEKPFVCEVCSKTFTDRGNLGRHKYIHTGEKPFICEVCCKEFSKNEYLIRHNRIHTGEKPFICEVCSKAFSERGTLCRHRLTHTRDKLFICEICCKTFSTRRYLNTHLRTHTSK